MHPPRPKPSKNWWKVNAATRGLIVFGLSEAPREMPIITECTTIPNSKTYTHNFVQTFLSFKELLYIFLTFYPQKKKKKEKRKRKKERKRNTIYYKSYFPLLRKLHYIFTFFFFFWVRHIYSFERFWRGANVQFKLVSFIKIKTLKTQDFRKHEIFLNKVINTRKKKQLYTYIAFWNWLKIYYF